MRLPFFCARGTDRPQRPRQKLTSRLRLYLQAQRASTKTAATPWFRVSLPSWRIMLIAIDVSARRTIGGFMVRPVSNSAQLVVFASGLLAAIGLCARAGQGSQSAPTTAASARRTQQPSSPTPAQEQTPRTARALTAATHDKNWMVRAAALEAISERGDRSLMDKVFPSLDDEKDDVRFTAAACVAHLSDLPVKRHGPKRRSQQLSIRASRLLRSTETASTGKRAGSPSESRHPSLQKCSAQTFADCDRKAETTCFAPAP